MLDVTPPEGVWKKFWREFYADHPGFRDVWAMSPVLMLICVIAVAVWIWGLIVLIALAFLHDVGPVGFGGILTVLGLFTAMFISLLQKPSAASFFLGLFPMCATAAIVVANRSSDEVSAYVALGVAGMFFVLTVLLAFRMKLHNQKLVPQ